MPKYQAFISYSRAADSRLAPELKASLQRFAKPWYKLRAIHVFCDQTNLTANPDLWGAIEKQIDDTEYFIYLASPKAAASKWVQKELLRFYNNGHADKIIIVLTDGNIVWSDETANFDWAHTDAVPNLPAVSFRQEPTWLDLTWIRKEQLSSRDPRFLDAIANLSAAIRNIDKDILIGQDVEEHRKAKRFRMLSMTGLALLALALAAATFFAFKSESRSQERLVRTFVGNGVALLESGDYEMSFPWFVQALINERNGDKKEMHRLRVDNLFLQMPELAQVWKTESPVLKTAFLSNQQVLIVSGPPVDWNSGQFECLNAKNGNCSAKINVVNIQTDEDVFAPIILTDGIRTMQLSNDKKRFASFSIRNGLQLWDVTNGKLVWEKRIGLPVKADAFPCSLAFSRQSDKLLLSYSNGDNGSEMDVFDASSGNRIAVCNEPNYGLGNPQFLAGADSIIFLDEGLKIWNSKSNTVSALKTPYLNTALSFAMNPDGRHIAISGYRDIKNFQGFGASVVSLVAYASVDSIQTPIFIKESDIDVNKLQFDAGGKILATNGSHTTEAASTDQGTRVWDLLNGNPLTGWIKLSQEVAVGFDEAGKKLVFSCNDGTTEVWDVGEPGAADNTERRWLLHDGDQNVKSIFSPDGAYLLTSGQVIKLWKAPQDASIQSIIDKQEFYDEEADTISQWFVTYGENNDDTTATKATEAYVYDKKSGKRLAVFKHESQVYKALLSPDGNLVATESGGTVFVWQRELQRLLYKIASPNNFGVQSMAFSMDSKKLAIAFFGFSIRIWDAATGIPVSPYMKHVVSAMDQLWVMFSKDGKTLLSTDNFRNAKLWDAATGDPLAAPVWIDNSAGEDSIAKRKQAAKKNNQSLRISAVSFDDLRLYSELVSAQQLESSGSFSLIPVQQYLEKWKKWKLAYKQ